MALQDIQTIVILMMENRSFDHTLGYLSLPGSQAPMPVDGLRHDPAWLKAVTNLDASGSPFQPHRLEPQIQAIDDPPHDSATIALQIHTPTAAGAQPAMGGFLQSYARRQPPPRDRSLVMGYYDQAAVPVYDFLARNFAVCNRWFAALPAGTQANRLMAMSGQSSILDNAPLLLPDQDLVYDWLEQHDVSWCAYQSGDFLPFFSLMPGWLPEILSSLTLSGLGIRARFRRYAKFREHWLAADAMPSVIFIEPEYTDGPHAEPDDDHPPTGIAKGQLLLADLYQSLTANPARWSKTLLLVTYDEHGGFFDHVAPLPIAADAGGTAIKTSGVRVPAFLVSPQIAPGTVLHDNYDHTSILQLLADRFDPGRSYSAAVTQRQAQLGRLAAALPERTSEHPTPQIPQAALTGLRQFASAAVVATGGAAGGTTANAEAMHKAALKAAREHPDLIRQPGWSRLAAYLQATQGNPAGS